MGEENGNERYLVNVSKLEKLMEEKRNEQNVKRIRALFKNSLWIRHIQRILQ